MQLTIIGAGAIGGTIGAHLIRDGHDVLLCDADQAHVDAINRAGLAIEGPVENFTVPARAVTPDELPAPSAGPRSRSRATTRRPRPGCWRAGSTPAGMSSASRTA